MITISEQQSIFIYIQPVDLRKSIDGLCLLLQEAFEQNPQSGDLYLFTNRARNKIKCLAWDFNGFVLYYKRLEKGRFNYSKYIIDEKTQITTKQLKALLMGLDFYILDSFPKNTYKDFF